MFNNALVGVDGKAGGRDAIALASRLVDPDGKLTLAHNRSGELRPSHAIAPGLLTEEREASEQMLERERAATGVSAELMSIVAFSPGPGLHRQAEEQNADLIVVGSCSRGAFGRAMLGDDTRGALNGASCAVAIAARGYAEHPSPFADVGVGYNGSPESIAALELAKKIAAPTRATVHALEVVSIPAYAFTGVTSPGLGEALETMVEKSNTRMEGMPAIEGHAVRGFAGEELATFSDKMDLIVVGSRSYGPIRRLVLGTTSDYLERHARCSLLVLPRMAREAVASEEPQTEAGVGAVV
jgi:nucleotide-binding universal stress UspA family protein